MPKKAGDVHWQAQGRPEHRNPPIGGRARESPADRPDRLTGPRPCRSRRNCTPDGAGSLADGQADDRNAWGGGQNSRLFRGKEPEDRQKHSGRYPLGRRTLLAQSTTNPSRRTPATAAITPPAAPPASSGRNSRSPRRAHPRPAGAAIRQPPSGVPRIGRRPAPAPASAA